MQHSIHYDWLIEKARALYDYAKKEDFQSVKRLCENILSGLKNHGLGDSFPKFAPYKAINNHNQVRDDYESNGDGTYYLTTRSRVRVSKEKFQEIVDVLPKEVDVFLDDNHTYYDYPWNDKETIDNDDLGFALENYVRSGIQPVYDNIIDDDYVDEMLHHHFKAFLEYFSDLFYNGALEEYSIENLDDNDW